MNLRRSLTLLAITMVSLASFTLSPTGGVYLTITKQAEDQVILKEYRSAILLYKKSLDLKPDQPEARQRLVELYVLKGKEDSAKAVLEDWIKLDPSDPRPLASLGAVLESQGQLDAAMDRLQQALSLQPRHREARHRLADLYFRLGRFEQARGEYELLLAQDDGDQQAHFRLGEIMAAANPSLAEDHLRKASSMETDLAIASYSEDLVGTLVEMREEADRAYAAASLGYMLLRFKEVPLAHRQFQEAIRLDPKFSDAHAYLGYTWFLQRRLDLAAESLAMAAELNPDSGFAHHVLGDVLRAQGRIDEALEEMKKAEAISPNDPILLSDLALTYLIVVNLSTAEDYYVKVADLARTNPVFVRQLANFYLDRMFRVDQGLAAARRVVELKSGNAEDLDLLGWALYLNGQRHEAEKTLIEARDLSPDMAIVHYHLAVLWERSGEVDKARRAYERAADLDLTGAIEKRSLAALDALSGS